MTAVRHRSPAPSLACDDAAHWSARSRCSDRRANPDWWFAAGSQYQALAVHICLSHCPVLDRCAGTQPQPWSTTAGIVYGEPRRGRGQRPCYHQPAPRSVGCPFCREDRHDRGPQKRPET